MKFSGLDDNIASGRPLEFLTISPGVYDVEITQAQLSQESGIAKSTISEVLAGKKPFSRQMIRKLADYFQVDVSVLTSNL